MIQYESQGPGARCPAGRSLEPVTINSFTPCQCFERFVSETISIESMLPCCAEGISLHHEMQSIARMSLHQEETRTPQGVHCPEACLHQSMVLPPWAPQAHHSRMLHLLACLPLLPRPIETQDRGPQLLARCGAPRLLSEGEGGVGTLDTLCASGRLVSSQGNGSFGCSVIYHLTHGRLTRIQRLFGAETCSTPVLNRT